MKGNPSPPNLNDPVVRIRAYFPELTAWATWTSGGYARGAALGSLMERYPARLSFARCQALKGEAVFARYRMPIGWDENLSVLLCMAGLDAEVLDGEQMTAADLLDDLVGYLVTHQPSSNT